MAWTYRIDRERDVLWITGSGVVTEREFVAGLEKVVRDEHFHPGIRSFHDYGELTSALIHWEALAQISQKRYFGPTSRSAFLVGSGFLDSMVKAYREIFGAGGDVRAFWTRSEAIAWLNEGAPEEKRIE